MLNFRVFETIADLVGAAAEEVLRTVEHSPRAVISLSGGSTPRPLYELLASRFGERIGRKRVIWVIGDERFVPPDDPQSNFRMISASLFPHGVPENQILLRFDTTVADPAADFERQWKDLEIYEIDLAILGMGEDGHTASLFPGTPILEVTDRIAAGVEVPRLGSRRLSVTLPHLRGARRKLVLATGGGKRETLVRVEAGESFPIGEVISGGGETWFFVDREAYPH